METVLVVMTNVPDAACADKIARAVVEARLAACVNCLPGVKSVYRWEGAVEEAVEITLMMKTTASRYTELQESIQSHHPYKVPEIIAFPVTAGSEPYLTWVIEETKRDIHV
jgi:periplasmic divalent cation tolerance protein